MALSFIKPFISELPGDAITENYSRQVKNACFSYVAPETFSNSKWVHKSPALITELELEHIHDDELLALFSGQNLSVAKQSYAMCYGGHQFGQWAGQLGDGRAINLGQQIHKGSMWTWQLKGAGPTPYSRMADGYAVLRSSIREHLCSEAMHALGVPTTRSLGIIESGKEVERDMMYDGNPKMEKGAIVCRIAPSFIRFGNFEILAAQEDYTSLKQLADYTIRHHFPEIVSTDKEAYIQLFKEVSERTLQLMLAWTRVGFVHGVMNTDNMSILGLTIDYGPYGWLEGFDPGWTPNTTDRMHKRYRFGQQVQIGLWNLVKLANALYPLIEEAKPLEEILNSYDKQFGPQFIEMMSMKLGLASKGTKDLVDSLVKQLSVLETDMTIFFRSIMDIGPDDEPHEMLEKINPAFYEDPDEDQLESWTKWLLSYQKTMATDMNDGKARRKLMSQTNPKYVLRNYMAQLAIDKAELGDYTLINELYTLLANPYSEQKDMEKWYAKRPEWARHKVGCSMLSCSS